MADAWYAKLITFLLPCGPSEPVITSSPVTEAYLNVEYVYDVDASAVPNANFYLIEGPNSMDINEVTGIITWTPTEINDVNVIVEANNLIGYDTQTFTVSVMEEPPFALRINCGGPTVIDGDITWVSSSGYVTGGTDYTFSTSSVDTTTNNIGEPVPPFAVYQKCRHQSPHTYSFPSVPNGEYKVRIHWTDQVTSSGLRQIDYDIEGVRVLEDWDIYAEAGGQFVAIDNEFTVTVSDGNGMQIVSSAASGDAFESAIEIVSAAPSAPVITSSAVTQGYVYQQYSYDVDATGNPVPQYMLSTSPNDMTIDANTGQIAWIPAVAGDYNVVVEAYNSQGSDSQSFTINVAEAPWCPENTSHYWKFDDSGQPYEDSIGTADGTCSSCPTAATGMIGGAMDFDGGDEVQVPDDGSYDWAADDSFTIAFWMKTDQTNPPRNMVVVGRDGGPTSLHWWIGTEVSTGKVRFQLKDTGNQGLYLGNKGPVLDDNQWHHIVCVRDESINQNRVYVDTVLVDSGTHDYANSFAESVPMNVGYIELSDRYHYDGLLDDLTMYNQALSVPEIQQQYINGKDGKGACIVPEEPNIISTAVTSASMMVQYTYDIDATSWPICDYSLVSGPVGFEVNEVNGLATWTPTLPGDYNIVVAATNIKGMDTQSFTITVTPYDGPHVTDLILSSTSGNDTTDDDLILDYNLAGGATTAAIAWKKNGMPQMALYMPMEGGAANALKDYSGNGHAPSNNGATWYADQGFDGGGCFYFEDDTILAGEVLQSNGSYTKMAWVKRTGNDTLNIISGDGTNNSHAFWCACAPGDGLGGGHEAGGWCDVESGTSFPTGSWHHVAISYNSIDDRLLLYMDGNEVGQGTADGPTNDPTIYVGGFGDNHEWRGYIDDVRVYNDVISEEQIAAVYNSEAGNIIVSQETTVGDTWQENITAFDTAEAGPQQISNTLTILPTPSAPNIISIPVTEAYFGELYSYDVNANGFPEPAYLLINAPNDMIIDVNTGLIEWTPMVVGDFNVVVEANNVEGYDQQGFSISVTTAPVCPNDMLAYLKMDDTNLPPIVDFYNGNDGVIASGDGPDPNDSGKVNGCLFFDGSDEVDIPDNYDDFDWGLNDSFSIELWMKSDADFSGNKVIISRDDGSIHWWIGGSGTGKAAFQLRDTNGNGQMITGASTINDGDWHHVVCVRDDSIEKNIIYVDGVHEVNITHDYTAGFESTTELNVGYISISHHYLYTGFVDELAIYGRALSPVEISDHYNTGLGKSYCCDDSDGDKYCDGVDNCPNIYNPDQNDFDSDGIGDLCDNCPVTSNPDQNDFDGDLYGDLCDNCPTIVNLDQADADSDSYGDLCDNCPVNYNPDQINDDSDSFGNVCDNCPTVTNPDQNDADADSHGNLCDNCPQYYNPDQNDSDGDTIGDACECYRANIDTINPIDFKDYSIIASVWLGDDEAADTNRDGVVDYIDVAQIAQHWLTSCP